MTRKWIVAGVLAVSLLFASVALAQGAPSVAWWVIGSGGGSASAGGVSLKGTIGQWMVGGGEAGNAQLGSGFWGGAAIEEFEVYLPLLVREA